MNYNFETIKQELQGQKGLIKKIRETYIPDTIAMSRIAQEFYESENNSFSDIDTALDELLRVEYELFKKRQQSVIDRFIEFADEQANPLNFPVLRQIIDDYKQASVTEEPTKILSGITKIIIALADSNRQSRVSRSGSSLMHHISYLLKKRGFLENEDYHREYVLKEGCKLDFFFPDFETYSIEPKNCCSVACQTTSNDRFRLTFAQMPNDTRNRACTAIGSKNFGERLGPSSLTDNKLDEAKKNGVKFVILETGIDERLKSSNAVMSYNEWFKELETIKKFW